jgi:hypothetical protein
LAKKIKIKYNTLLNNIKYKVPPKIREIVFGIIIIEKIIISVPLKLNLFRR